MPICSFCILNKYNKPPIGKGRNGYLSNRAFRSTKKDFFPRKMPVPRGGGPVAPTPSPARLPANVLFPEGKEYSAQTSYIYALKGFNPYNR